MYKVGVEEGRKGSVCVRVCAKETECDGKCYQAPPKCRRHAWNRCSSVTGDESAPCTVVCSSRGIFANRAGLLGMRFTARKVQVL